jgi:hypothetical protein
MVGLLRSVGGWLGLVCATAFSCCVATASAAPPDVARVEADAAPRERIRFLLLPSHDGIRTAILDEVGHRQTSLADVPAGAECRVVVRDTDDFTRGLRLRCGSGLNVMAFVDPIEHTLGIRGFYDFARDGTPFSDDLPVAPGTLLELDGALSDPAPPPSCAGIPEQRVDLALDHVPRDSDLPRYPMEHVRLRADFGPIAAHVETPWCKRTCVGKGDVSGHEYEYRCGCTSEPYETSMKVRVENGTLTVSEVQSMPDIGFTSLEGRWQVPCGARLHYPEGTEILPCEEGYFELSPEEKQADEEAWREFEWEQRSWEEGTREEGTW